MNHKQNEPLIVWRLFIYSIYTMRLIVLLLILAFGTFTVFASNLSMFYCGFGANFCGQSYIDDVNPNADIVILAFANTQPDGSVIYDDTFNPYLVFNWQSSGKKVLISIGGQNGNWPNVFATPTSTTNFINALSNITIQYGLDGVDLDIENYIAAPRTVANMIIDLRKALGPNKLIVVSPEDVVIFQDAAVPTADASNGYYNYFVPIVQLADYAIDYYQPQAYNNYFHKTPGTLDYFKDVYLNWRNFQGLATWAVPIPNFTGVDGNKIRMGVLASTSAGGSNYYANASVIVDFRVWLANNSYPLNGFMMWDSNWDALNGFIVSNACI